MIVGIYKLSGRIEVFSLKEKRQIIKSLVHKIQNKYHISIAETGVQDNLQQVEIGMAIVSNNKPMIEKSMEQILSFIESHYAIEIFEWDFEFIYFDN
ncbi:DUF503 domain-containing protein [Aerococcaceae bacterium DSM 111022]|nr:DUF503 domain-containing protein [Aerococcaceae bacterium DSM 111022]